MLRNRAAAGRAHRQATGRRHPEFGGGALADAAHGLAQRLLSEAPELARDIAALTKIGGALAVSDPTSGALYVHHHWQSPAWAERLKATALIGPYLFLTVPNPKGV